MACENRIRKGQTAQSRQNEIDEALQKLEQKLQDGGVQLVIAENGGLLFQGWEGAERNDVNDACAFQKLVVMGSFALQQALAQAEAMAGRSANYGAVMGGLHSHDGGQSWGKH
jgi:hypothetical protein